MAKTIDFKNFLHFFKISLISFLYSMGFLSIILYHFKFDTDIGGIINAKSNQNQRPSKE